MYKKLINIINISVRTVLLKHDSKVNMLVSFH